MSTPRPDTAAILGQLKDFQQDTVDYVFRRMYLDEDCSRRFLVADEVGLGKTLIARGVIAKAIDHLWARTRRIDVVYVCSNADIARQNINRLNITGKKDFELASRITLLPITMQKLAQQKQLIYWLLRAHWDFSEAKGTRVLEGWSRTENFRAYVNSFPRRHSIHGGIANEFCKRLDADGGFKKRFDSLCDAVPRSGVAFSPSAI